MVSALSSSNRTVRADRRLLARLDDQWLGALGLHRSSRCERHLHPGTEDPGARIDSARHVSRTFVTELTSAQKAGRRCVGTPYCG